MRFGQVIQKGSASVATVPILLCGPAPTREVLTFGIDGGVGYVTTNQAAAAGVGFPVVAGFPLVLTYEDYGEMVRAAWYGSADSNARKFGVMDPSEARP